MNTAFIKAISYYLPEKVITNTELAALFPEWAVEKIAKKTGIDQRHIAAPDEFASDMAVAAAQKLFNEHSIKPEEIDFILYCTQSPDYFLPTTACILQEKLGISIRAGALDFNLGCSGFVYGLAIAKGLVVAGIAKNILLITSETYSKYIHEKDKSNRTIFGDAAAATLVSNEGFARINEFVLGTDGKGAENLIVKEGGARFPQKNKDAVTMDDFGNSNSDACLHMNGAEIFNFTSGSIPALVAETIEKNKLNKEDIDQFILHQANQFMLDHLRKKMTIPVENFYIYMSQVGNTVSSTIPIAMAEAIKTHNHGANTNWLLAGFGVGYSWGATVITFS